MVNNELIKQVENYVLIMDKEYKIKFSYLFGSFARGEENSSSDIDIAVMFEKDYSNYDDALIRGKIIDNGKLVLKKEVDIVSLNRGNLSLKYEIIKDGIVIKDSDDRASFESLTMREYFDFKYFSDIYNESIIKSIKEGTYF